MPRTKVSSKSSKRSREAKNLRMFEKDLDTYLEQLDCITKTHICQFEANMNVLFSRTSAELLQMKMADVLEIENFMRFKDWNEETCMSKSIRSSDTAVSSLQHQFSNKIVNPNDEGYLTEDSARSSSTAGSIATHFRPKASTHTDVRGRTPGPLNSARARKQRRSRSACSESTVTIPTIMMTAHSHNLTSSDHASRQKMRTPIASRVKAFSADRSVVQLQNDPQSPAAAFLRWPKPGEIVLSKCGSPIVAHIAPEKYANVNIPVMNGVLSLRPKKIGALQPELVNAIGKDTLAQIKTLHANLDLIVNMAEGTHIK